MNRKTKKLLIFYLFIFFVFCYASNVKSEEILEHTYGDLQSSFVQWPVAILVGGGIASAILYRYDDDVQDYFSHHQISSKYDKIGDRVGNPYILSGLIAANYGVSLLANNQEFKLFSETLAEAAVFNAIMVEGLKYSFRRTRPNGDILSFPSGHSATAFTIASVFQSMEGWKFGVPAYAVASAISFSRIDANEHHLTDVVFGAALGTCIGLGTSLFHKQGNTHLLISPILDQTRGIMLSYKFQ